MQPATSASGRQVHRHTDYTLQTTRPILLPEFPIQTPPPARTVWSSQLLQPTRAAKLQNSCTTEQPQPPWLYWRMATSASVTQHRASSLMWELLIQPMDLVPRML